MDITSGAVGAGLLGFVYFVALQLRKWIPVAWSAAKARLVGGGKIDLASIEALAAGKVQALEQGAVAEVKKDLATALSELALLKTNAPQLFAPAPAPQAQPQAAPAA